MGDQFEIKFKKGDRVRFVPLFGTYTKGDQRAAGKVAVVMDNSDIPTIKFLDASRQLNYGLITAALQEDLVKI